MAIVDSGKVDGEEVFNRHQLEMCVFTYVAEHLRSGDLYIAGSEAFADYRTQFLPWEECQSILDSYCDVVGLPKTAAEFVEKLRTQLTKLAQAVDEAQTGDSGLYFDESGKPHLNKLPGQIISEDNLKLEKILHDRMPERHLLDILHHVHHWAEYTRHFGPPSGADPKLQDPIPHYLLTVFGYGCNLGPAQTARHNRHLVSSVSWVGSMPSISRLRNWMPLLSISLTNMLAFRFLLYGGTGKASIADGTQYPLYENNLLGERHIRYGGYGGIAHHHISDTYVALFSHFIACGVWEAVYLLDGILQNKSVLQPDTVHADTQGQSEVVFGLAHLLGIELLPECVTGTRLPCIVQMLPPPISTLTAGLPALPIEIDRGPLARFDASNPVYSQRNGSPILAVAEINHQQSQEHLISCLCRIGTCNPNDLHLEIRFPTSIALRNSGSYDENRSLSGFLCLGFLAVTKSFGRVIPGVRKAYQVQGFDRQCNHVAQCGRHDRCFA